jgi:DNA (cytosine-5)-methyltransferase 1
VVDRRISLFAGGGGLDLAVDLACGPGQPLVYVEREAVAVEILASRMEAGLLAPAPICTDVRELDGREFRDRCDLIYGGFPCTDISLAGKGAGIDGEHSGLWSEFARIIGVVRPPIVYVENVPALVIRGLDRAHRLAVLGNGVVPVVGATALLLLAARALARPG